MEWINKWKGSTGRQRRKWGRGRHSDVRYTARHTKAKVQHGREQIVGTLHCLNAQVAQMSSNTVVNFRSNKIAIKCSLFMDLPYLHSQVNSGKQ